MMKDLLYIIAFTYVTFSCGEMFIALSSVWNERKGGRLKRTAKAFVWTVFTCPRCYAWWSGLLLTGSWIGAAFASMAMAVLDRFIHR